MAVTMVTDNLREHHKENGGHEKDFIASNETQDVDLILTQFAQQASHPL